MQCSAFIPDNDITMPVRLPDYVMCRIYGSFVLSVERLSRGVERLSMAAETPGKRRGNCWGLCTTMTPSRELVPGDELLPVCTCGEFHRIVTGLFQPAS
jgi:hypothetical protein